MDIPLQVHFRLGPIVAKVIQSQAKSSIVCSILAHERGERDRREEEVRGWKVGGRGNVHGRVVCVVVPARGEVGGKRRVAGGDEYFVIMHRYALVVDMDLVILI